jgi:hypothetical protein
VQLEQVLLQLQTQHQQLMVHIFHLFVTGSSSANATFKTNFGNGYFGTTAVSSATSDESGLGIFEYTVPSGYYALCTKNINEQEYD